MNGEVNNEKKKFPENLEKIIVYCGIIFIYGNKE